MRNSKDTSTLDILTGGLRIGYARTSKQDQNLDLQRDALIAAGCTRIYEEQISGAKTNRPELEQMLRRCAQVTPLSSGSSPGSVEASPTFSSS